MWKAILFDLDGTLLPMDMEVFTKGYFTLLAQKAAPYGYESDKLIQTVWQGTRAMVENDGSVTNEMRFWHLFAAVYGEEALKDKRLFDSFYENEFCGAVAYTEPRPAFAQAALAVARQRAEWVILATNPIFPRAGVEARLAWIGLTAADFDFVTTYENSTFCKPNPRYYAEILTRMDLPPGKALMVGNDVEEDVLAADSTGMQCFLVRDCMINPKGFAVTCPSGSLNGLAGWLQAAK